MLHMILWFYLLLLIDVMCCSAIDVLCDLAQTKYLLFLECQENVNPLDSGTVSRQFLLTL